MNFNISPRTINILTDFIPIILIYLFVSQPKETIYFSNTSLGKFIVVCLIVFYSTISLTHGLFVCAILILYYQTDLVEYQRYHYHDLRFEEGLMNMTYDLWNGGKTTESLLTNSLEPAPYTSGEELQAFVRGSADVYQFTSSLTETEKKGMAEKTLSTSDPFSGHGVANRTLFPYIF
jgi:hypothetical protein